MSWFGFTRKKAIWGNVLPMLYPFELDTAYIDQSDASPEIIEGNRISSLPGPCGLRVHLLDQSDDGVAQIVNNRMLHEWRISIEDLFTASVENLERDILPKVEPIRLEDAPEDIVFLQGASSYSASLILSKRLWGNLGFEREDVVIAIPHRELLFIGDRNSEATASQLKHIVQQTFSDQDTPTKHLLLNDLAIYDGKVRFSWKPSSLN